MFIIVRSLGPYLHVERIVGTARIGVCGVAAELALVQCFAIRFLTNPKTIMQS